MRSFPVLSARTYTVSSLPISFSLNLILSSNASFNLLSASESFVSDFLLSFSVLSVLSVLSCAVFAANTFAVETPVPTIPTTSTPAIIRITYFFVNFFFNSGNFIFFSSSILLN